MPTALRPETTEDRVPPAARRRLGAPMRGGVASFGLVLVIAIVAIAIAAPFIAPFDPNQEDLSRALQPPGWLGGAADALFGTDYLGRDILSRVVYGTRISLLIGLLSVAIGGAVGSTLGVLAGYRGGTVDAIVMRLADLQLSIPWIVLAIAFVGALGPSVLSLVIVLVITGWVSYARIARSEVLSLREREFVLAARAVGAGPNRIMWRHIRPNVAASLVVLGSLEVGRIILSEAALSFLGLGVQPPTPSWGGMIAEGRNYLQSAWWLTTFPGLAIVATVFSINLFGDWLRDMLDPRRRARRGGS